LYISLGSCAEVNTQLVIAVELNYITKDVYEKLSSKVELISRMIRNLIKALK
jgi:four helix bundle protein